jgi:hypothetical protein
MRIMYQNGELLLSLTRDEVDHVSESKGTPVKMDIKMLKVLHEDISKAVLSHWSNVEVWEAIEEHLKSHKNKSKIKK